MNLLVIAELQCAKIHPKNKLTNNHGVGREMAHETDQLTTPFGKGLRQLTYRWLSLGQEHDTDLLIKYHLMSRDSENPLTNN